MPAAPAGQEAADSVSILNFLYLAHTRSSIKQGTPTRLGGGGGSDSGGGGAGESSLNGGGGAGESSLNGGGGGEFGSAVAVGTRADKTMRANAAAAARLPRIVQLPTVLLCVRVLCGAAASGMRGR